MESGLKSSPRRDAKLMQREVDVLESEDNWQLKGLAAIGPNSEFREKMMLFGQFIGDWEIKEKWLQPDGTWGEGTGAVHFAWILEGTAIQDIWSDYEGNPPREVPVGTTIRFYDPKIDAWHVTWIAPKRGAIKSLVARQIGGEIVLEGNVEGHAVHWIFSEITPNSFRWRAEESYDDQKTWQLTEDMSIRRSNNPT